MAEPKVLTAAEVSEIRAANLVVSRGRWCDSHELLRAENTWLTKERDEALADVERKEHALELALIKNVEVLQIKLRDHYESTPEGFFSALTELRAENKAAREFFEAHGSPEECAKFIDKADALQDENTRLKGLIEGMPCEAGCATYNHSGDACALCGVGRTHTGMTTCHGSPHLWKTTPAGKCNCVKSRVNA